MKKGIKIGAIVLGILVLLLVGHLLVNMNWPELIAKVHGKN